MFIFFLDWLFNISLRARSEVMMVSDQLDKLFKQAGAMLIIILAIYTLNIGFKTEIPKVRYLFDGHLIIIKVSYITYFDVWAFFCVLPIFFVIWEWTVTELMESMGKGATKKKIQKISSVIVATVYATFTISYWIFVIYNTHV